MPIPRFIALIVSLLCAILLGGCKAKTEFWVNPDGSGRVVLDYTDVTRPDMCSAALPNLNAERMLQSWSGIEAWSVQTYAEQGSGYHLKATGFFSRINEVYCTERIGYFRPVATIERGRIVAVGFKAEPSIRPAPHQNFAGGSLSNVQDPVKEFRELCDRQLLNGTSFHKKEVEALRAMRAEYVIHAPGKTKNQGRPGETEDGVSITIDGANYMDYCQDLMRDDDSLRKITQKSSHPEDFYLDPQTWKGYLAKTYGGELMASVDGDQKAFFNYATELKAHSVPYAKAMTDAGLASGFPATNNANQVSSVDSSGSLSIRVTTRVAYDDALRIGEITKEVAEDGTVVLPASTTSREVDVMPVEKGKGSLDWPCNQFDLGLKVPAGVKRFKLIQGYFLAVYSGGYRTYDLPGMEIKPGATSKDGSVLILDVSPLDPQGNPTRDAQIQFATEGWSFINNVGMTFGQTTGDFGRRQGSGFTGHGYCYQSSESVHGGIMTGMTVVRMINPKVIKVPFELRNVELK